MKRGESIREPPEEKKGWVMRSITWMVSFDFARWVGIVVLSKKQAQKWLNPDSWLRIQIGQWIGFVYALGVMNAKGLLTWAASLKGTAGTWWAAKGAPLVTEGVELVGKTFHNLVDLFSHSS